MEIPSAKTCRLNIRCDSATRALLDKAASYTRLSVSGFVLQHAVASAERVVDANENIALTLEDFMAFLAVPDAPKNIPPALKKAFKRHDELIVQ